jgi:hypothetical protein
LLLIEYTGYLVDNEGFNNSLVVESKARHVGSELDNLLTQPARNVYFDNAFVSARLPCRVNHTVMLVFSFQRTNDPKTDRSEKLSENVLSRAEKTMMIARYANL